MINDEHGQSFFGADQEWYPLLWQRKAGCGPTTASHLVLYTAKKHPHLSIPQVTDKQSMVDLMEAMWLHVTPGIMGTHLVSQFTKGLSGFLAERSIDLAVDSLALSKSRSSRAPLDSVVAFIEKNLNADQPVAFLNLNAGAVQNLDSWHWVTIVGLEQELKDGPYMIDVFDGGKMWKINLALWYETTTRSGGFASLKG